MQVEMVSCSMIAYLWTLFLSSSLRPTLAHKILGSMQLLKKHTKTITCNLSRATIQEDYQGLEIHCSSKIP